MSDCFATSGTAAYQAPAPWDFPGKNTGVGCHFLSPGNLPNRGIQGIIYYWATGKILLSLGFAYSRHFLINWIIEYVVFHDWLLRFMYKFFCGHKFPVLLDTYPRSRISGSYSNFMFNFLRYSHILFHHGCITLHSHQEYMRLPISQHPYQQLLSSHCFWL